MTQVKKINNCSNCRYKNGKTKCNRPLEAEGRIATNLGNIEGYCPCHSVIDGIKYKEKFINDGLFTVSKKQLKELEKFIFG